MKTKISKIFSFVLITTVLSGCFEPEGVNDAQIVDAGMPDDQYHNGIYENPDIGNVVGGNSSVIGDFQEAGATDVAIAISDVGLKDFEQIYMTMSVLTGIDPNSESGIRNAYADLTTALPNDSSVKRFNSNIQFSIFKLATEYCNVMLNNSNYYNAVFKSLNIDQGIKTNDALKSAAINDLIDRFWGGSAVQEATLLTTSRSELKILLDELYADETNSATATRKVVKGVCAAMLSTPQVTML